MRLVSGFRSSLKSKILSVLIFPVLSVDETFRWMESGGSIVRFGDGELSIIFGRRGPKFQAFSCNLRRELSNAINYNHPALLRCLPRVINAYSEVLDCYNDETILWWKRWILGRFWNIVRLYVSLKDGKYGDAAISRPYSATFGERKCEIDYKSYFDRFIDLFAGRDIIIVEGAETKFGVGNDLLSRSKSVRRILVPAVDAYSKVDDVCRCVDSVVSKASVFILACGPLAKILAKRLVDRGLIAWDLGHLDIEYEWWIRNAREKINIPGKYVNEASIAYVDSEDQDIKILRNYRSQIIFDVSC